MGEEDEKESGECAVCQKMTRLKCGNCRVQFYCDKKHQKEDWTRHRSSCQAWEIQQSDRLGRYLVAARDLKEGDVIIAEMPIMLGPRYLIMGDLEEWVKQHRSCVGCGDKSYNGGKCPRCSCPACCADCEGLTDPKGHGLECALLQKCRIIPRLDVLLPLRMLIHWRTKSKTWSALSELQSHAECRTEGTDAHKKDAFIIEHLAPIIAVVPEAAAVIPEICGMIDINAFDVTIPGCCDYEAFYKTACLMEHSCSINTRYKFTFVGPRRPRIEVLACRPIKKGEHITTMYTHALWPTQKRQQHLLSHKFFECRCERCADPTEFGTHLSTLKCRCDGGLILPQNPLDRETVWSCNLCSATMSSPEVAQLVFELGNEMDMAWDTPTPENFSDVLARFEERLHPGHAVCIGTAHPMVTLLPAEDPRRLELCKRLLKTLLAIDPYGARIPVYTAIVLRALALCPGQDKKEHLAKAVSLLKYEPEEIEGGVYMRLLQSELSAP